MANNEELLYQINVDQKALLKQLDKVEKSFNSTFDDIDKSAKKINIVGSILKADALKAGLKTAKDLMVSGIQKIVEETSQLQDATLDWEMLTGSAELAGKKIKEVYDFANRTPFDTKEVNTAATNLYKVSQGALGATEDLVRLGDAAKKGQVPIVELSTTYGRLYNKLTNGEKAFSDEINRMTDLGLVTFKTKQSLQQMDEQLLKTEGIKLLNEDLDKAKGTMERFSQNISGKLGTLGSEWDQIFAFDNPEVQESIKDTLDTLINTLNVNKPIIQDILKDTFGVIGDVISGMIIEISNLWKYFHPELEELKDYQFTAQAELHQMKMKYSDKELKAELTKLKKIEKGSANAFYQQTMSKPNAGADSQFLSARYNVEQELLKQIETGDLLGILETLDEKGNYVNDTLEGIATNFIMVSSKAKLLGESLELTKKQSDIKGTTETTTETTTTSDIDTFKFYKNFIPDILQIKKAEIKELDLPKLNLIDNESSLLESLEKYKISLDNGIPGEYRTANIEGINIKSTSKNQKKLGDEYGVGNSIKQLATNADIEKMIDLTARQTGRNDIIKKQEWRLDKLSKEIETKRGDELNESGTSIMNADYLTEEEKTDFNKTENERINNKWNDEQNRITTYYNEQIALAQQANDNELVILEEIKTGIQDTNIENSYNIKTAMEEWNSTTEEWANRNNIINSFVNPTVSIISSWANDSMNIFSKLSSTTSGVGGALSGLTESGLIDKTSGIASLIGGLTGFGSIIGGVGSLVDLFSNDSDDEDVNDTYATNNSKTADIVSTAVDTIIVNANMSVYTTYVDEAGFDQMFSEQIAPRFAELVQGVY